jgi:hypothetical protein
MPGLPLMMEEEFVFGGQVVPQRFFDLSAEADTRAYLVRVFDAGDLDPESRRALRDEAESLMMPAEPRVVHDDVVRREGREVHRMQVEGYPIDHTGELRSFVDGGFVWQMLVITQTGTGQPTDGEAFFGSAQLGTRGAAGDGSRARDPD